MGEATVTLSVSVEAAVHSAIKHVCEKVRAEHGILVHRIEVEWLYTGTVEDSTLAIVSVVRLDTSTRHG